MITFQLSGSYPIFNYFKGGYVEEIINCPHSDHVTVPTRAR